MNTIDIRTGKMDSIDCLKFADNSNNVGWGDNIAAVSKDGDDLYFHTIDDLDCEDNQGFVKMKDIPNLILALQKAVELGWVPAPVVPKPVAAKKPAAKK